MSSIAPFPFTVKLADGSTEKLLIKALSITQLYSWLYAAIDRSEPAMVAICTGKTSEWVDSLDVDSFGALAQKCYELNFQLAIRLAKKGAPVAAALLAPLMDRHVNGLRVIRALTTSTGSGDSSPTPQPSGSAPETASASPTPTQSTDSAKS